MDKIKNIKEEFINPNQEYTPFPFWFWNGDFSEIEITNQMKQMKARGVEGFVLHPRIGIPKRITYLGPEFFHYIKFGVALAKELDMKVLLYDEGMYPSGSANGQVVKAHPEYASKGIYVSTTQDLTLRTDRFQKIIGYFNWNDTTKKADFVSEIREAQYALVFEDSLGTIRGIHFGEDDGEPNAPRSTDLLNSAACEYFISITHDKYYAELKDYFGTTVIGFFTDEPDILGRNHPEEMLPFNDELVVELAQQKIQITDLPELFLGANQNLREQYQECVTAQLQKSYYQPISSWCANHHIILTGHPHDAHDIGLLKNFQIPGQDIVWRWVAPENELGIKGRESVTAKCSADAARHSGSARNLSECFGCCGPNGVQWAFSTDDMKWYLDWLFTRGVNLIVPHAFFYSHAEKQLADRPPDVGLNNLWWDDYAYFSTYIKRMSFMMSKQVNTTNIAVLAEKNRLPYEGMAQLIQHQIDFNYLEDTYLFEKKFTVQNGFLNVAKQHYNVLLVDEYYLKKQAIATILEEYVREGGTILYIKKEETVAAQLPTLLKKYQTKVHLSGEQLADLRYSEFTKENETFFLLGNEGEEERHVTVSFTKVSDTVEVWHPWEGRIDLLNVKDQTIQLRIPRRTVLFLHQGTQPSSETNVYPSLKGMKLVLPYQLVTDCSQVTTLGSWTEHQSLLHFSGTVTYTLTFEIHEVQERLPEEVILNLGKVKNMAALFLDGQKVATKFWAPFRFKIPKEALTKPIQIQVTNTLANQKEHAALPSGLIGPVSIEQ